ncbi:hypothetical protein SAMN05421820_11568 [Pedobacter steynii]|uniref:Uncharacterized protein n=1 Tax=Pedobacter steynii TaxID=430522 RepID=A0A1H0JSX8_9SPHI|nr:hypothetical protein SAMN05421820_11568 [Pedobacter steynii]
MNLFIEKHQDLLKELLLKKVDFIVIGGYSVLCFSCKCYT